MLDPHNPRECIATAGSFSRIADLLARYLHSNAQREGNTKAGENIEAEETDGNALKVGRLNTGLHLTADITKFQVTVESNDNKTLRFEWSSPIKKALKWML